LPRVCFLLNNEYLSDNRVRREAEALSEKGFEVTILCIQVQKNTLENASQIIPPEKEVIQPTAASPGGIIIRRLLKKRLYKYHALSLRMLKACVKILAAEKPFDVVHAHDANMLMLGMILSRVWRSKLVYDAHEYWKALFDEQEERLSQQAEKAVSPAHLKSLEKKLTQLLAIQQFEVQAFRFCHHLITVSDGIAQRLQEAMKESFGKTSPAKKTIPVKPITVIRNTPELFPRLSASSQGEGSPLHKELNLPETSHIILYQGQIAEERGITVLVEAMALFLKDSQRKDVYLVMMGPILPSDLDYQQSVLKKIETQHSHAQNHILFKDAVPASSLLFYSAGASLGIHPILNTSQNNYLCLPNKIFEYIQAGIPVGVSHFPEMKKIVDTYHIGFTFNPESPQELAQKLQTFFAPLETLAPTFKDALTKAKEDLCWEKEKEKLWALYVALFLPPP
jgi:glycosyltransferase involved in cell wall biosynthesis